MSDPPRERPPRNRGSFCVYTLGMRIQAIRARQAPIGMNFSSLIEAELGARGFIGAVHGRMTDYPPQVGAGQSLGKKFGARQPKRRAVGTRYRRTGTYGRNWRIRGPRHAGDGLMVEDVNRTDYAVYVGGDPKGPPGNRQVPIMGEYGWQNVRQVAREEWRNYRPAIVNILQQRDRRLERRRYFR